MWPKPIAISHKNENTFLIIYHKIVNMVEEIFVRKNPALLPLEVRKTQLFFHNIPITLNLRTYINIKHVFFNLLCFGEFVFNWYFLEPYKMHGFSEKIS